MLSPQARTLLRDALRPPVGFEIDQAVMTTYSLDLMTLLTVPLAFTFFEIKDTAGPLQADPLALIEALRRHADQLTIFCQQGQILLPKNVQLLLGYLEKSVIQVASPREGGVFHPKVAVLRYVGKDDRNDVRYRFLCSSRNLTFDRSWDTLLVLEGALDAARKNAHSRNRPLASFLRALPTLVPPHMSRPDLPHVAAMADEVLKVRFEPPEGLDDDFEFCPMGIDGGAEWPVLGGKRSVIVSPFVTDGFVARLNQTPGERWLVSRHESLDELSTKSLHALKDCFSLHDGVESVEVTAEAPAEPAPQSEADTVHAEPSHQLTGLHAKLFITDDGKHANIWTGSANATTAAFERNVEFLVRLRGVKSKFGVGVLLRLDDDDDAEENADRSVQFADMLIAYRRVGEPVIDHVQQRLEESVESARQAILAAGLHANVEVLPDGSGRYRFAVSATHWQPPWDKYVQVTMGLITLRGESIPLALDAQSSVTVFEPLSFEALTSFASFRVRSTIDDRTLECSFVVKLPVTGLPEDRQDRILLSLLKNRQQLLRYLLLLLADDEDSASQLEEILSRSGQNARTANEFGLPLLEALLRAFDRNPARLAQIEKLLADLLKTAEGSKLIPGGFQEIWQPIWEASRRAPKAEVKRE